MVKRCGIIPVLRIECPMIDLGREDGLLDFEVRCIKTKKAITVNNKSYKLVLEIIDGEISDGIRDRLIRKFVNLLHL